MAATPQATFRVDPTLWQGINLKRLKNLARDTGLDEKRIQNSDDTEDPKAAVMQLISEKVSQGMNLKQLKNLARAVGFDEKIIVEADDTPDPKAAVMKLLSGQSSAKASTNAERISMAEKKLNGISQKFRQVDQPDKALLKEFNSAIEEAKSWGVDTGEAEKLVAEKKEAENKLREKNRAARLEERTTKSEKVLYEIVQEVQKVDQPHGALLARLSSAVIEAKACNVDAKEAEQLLIKKKQAEDTTKYIVIYDGLPVNEAQSRESPQLSTLPLGTRVEVVEIADASDGSRVRGRIVDPAGWISIKSEDGSGEFAIKAEMTGSSDLQRSIVYRTQGLERKQEDAYKVADQLVEWDTGSWGYVGVFDGHSGAVGIVNLVEESLHLKIKEKLESEDVKPLLSEALLASAKESPSSSGTDDSDTPPGVEVSDASQILKRSVFDPVFLEMDKTAAHQRTTGGTTLTVLLFWHPRGGHFIGKRVFVANLGDSSVAVINLKNMKAFHLTKDHAPSYSLEEILATERGGKIRFVGGAKRLNGELVVSRSIGDHNNDISQTPGYSCEPDVLEYSPQPGDVIVAASDGLWDMLLPYLDSIRTRDIVELSKQTGLSDIQQNGIRAFSKQFYRTAWSYDGQTSNDAQSLTEQELDMSWNRDNFKVLQGLERDAGSKLYWDYLLVEPTRSRQAPDLKHPAPLERVNGLVEYTAWSRTATMNLIDGERLELVKDSKSLRGKFIYYKVIGGPTVDCKSLSFDAIYKLEVPSFLEFSGTETNSLDDVRAKLESKDPGLIVNAIFIDSRKPTNPFFAAKLWDLIEGFRIQAMKGSPETAANVEWDESADGSPDKRSTHCGQEALKIGLGVDAYKFTMANGYENVQDNMTIAVVNPNTFGNMDKFSKIYQNVLK